MWQHQMRVLTGTGEFLRYRREGVFPPSNWLLQNYNMFCELQLPSNTTVDAVEFLTCAQFACDRVLRAIYSPNVVNYVVPDNKSKRPPRPPELMEVVAIFGPLCFEPQFLPHIKAMKGPSHIALTDLEFTGAYLTRVDCAHTTLAGLKADGAFWGFVDAELHNRKRGGKLVMKNMVSEFHGFQKRLEEVRESVTVTDEEMATEVERVRLDTLFNTVRTVSVTRAKTSELVVVKDEIETKLRFESLVTQPKDLDWRIVNITQRLLKRSRVN